MRSFYITVTCPDCQAPRAVEIEAVVDSYGYPQSFDDPGIGATWEVVCMARDCFCGPMDEEKKYQIQDENERAIDRAMDDYLKELTIRDYDY
jgi:hypothetical protein